MKKGTEKTLNVINAMRYYVSVLYTVHTSRYGCAIDNSNEYALRHRQTISSRMLILAASSNFYTVCVYVCVCVKHCRLVLFLISMLEDMIHYEKAKTN